MNILFSKYYIYIHNWRDNFLENTINCRTYANFLSLSQIIHGETSIWVATSLQRKETAAIIIFPSFPRCNAFSTPRYVRESFFFKQFEQIVMLQQALLTRSTCFNEDEGDVKEKKRKKGRTSARN